MWEEIRLFAPDIFGITSVTPNFMSARRAAAEAKRVLGCPVIMGGPHVTALPRATLLGTPAVDAVILGEGEIPLLALAGTFDASGKVDFSRIPGAAFMEAGQYRENPRPEPISDLDSLPPPARDLLEAGRRAGGGLRIRKPHSALLLTSRGCPSQCTYCANICMGRKFRAHSPGYVVSEMERIIRDYGIRNFQIVDDCFTADPARVSAICDLILQKRLKITWNAAARVNTMRDEALVRKMWRAGCRYVVLGIETGNQRVNDLMKKGTTLQAAEECCSVLRRTGMPFMNSFIVGNEGDTEETVLETIAFAQKLKASISAFHMLIPYPGTPLFNKYYADYDKPYTDWDGWVSNGPDRPYETRQTKLSKQDLLRLSRRAYWRIYLNPMQLLRVIAFGLMQQ